MNDTVATEDQEQPATPHERKARSHDRDPDSRTPSRPADICSASTGRTYDRSRPNRSKRKNSACQGGTSTYEGCWVKSYSAAVWKFRLISSRFLPRLAVSHGGGEADRVAQPLPWRFQDAGHTKHYSRLHDRDGGSRHATSRAVADTAHRADQINVQVSRLSSGQRAIRFAAIPLSARALPHLRPRHRRTSHPVAAYSRGHQNSSYSRSSGSERAEPIFVTASCSQDVMRSARRDPARVSFPRGWRDSLLTLRAGSGRFQHSPLRHFSLCHVAPEGD